MSTSKLDKNSISEEAFTFVLQLNGLGFYFLIFGWFKSKSIELVFAASVYTTIWFWISFSSFTYVYFDVIRIKTACWTACFPTQPIHWIVELKLIGKFYWITTLIFGLSISILYILLATKIVHLVFILPLSLKSSVLIALSKSGIIEKLGWTHFSNLWGYFNYFIHLLITLIKKRTSATILTKMTVFCIFLACIALDKRMN